MAQRVATAAESGGAEVRLRNFLGSLGGLWAEGKPADKVYAAFTSSNTVDGGRETVRGEPGLQL